MKHNPALALLRRGFDRVTIYLPIIMTGLLALGTYWLVRNAPKLLEATPVEAPSHEPDYFMRGFVVKSFQPNGELRSEISGKEGRHYPDNDTTEIDAVRMRSFSKAGFLLRATADRGLSNADATEVQLFGNAVVVRDAATGAAGKRVPRLEFRGDFLHAYLDTEQVRSHKPVTLIRDNDQFTADSLDYDNSTGVADLKGRVRGLLVPGARPGAVRADP